MHSNRLAATAACVTRGSELWSLWVYLLLWCRRPVSNHKIAAGDRGCSLVLATPGSFRMDYDYVTNSQGGFFSMMFHVVSLAKASQVFVGPPFPHVVSVCIFKVRDPFTSIPRLAMWFPIW